MGTFERLPAASPLVGMRTCSSRPAAVAPTRSARCRSRARKWFFLPPVIGVASGCARPRRRGGHNGLLPACLLLLLAGRLLLGHRLGRCLRGRLGGRLLGPGLAEDRLVPGPELPVLGHPHPKDAHGN